MSSTTVFIMLVSVVALQRLWEVSISKQNERALLEEGAEEHAPRQMLFMTALHTLWLVSTVVESLATERRLVWGLSISAFVLFLVGQLLRISAMRTLGRRWTVKIITPVTPEAPVAEGIYKYVRHPNYLGVVLELAALPLIHGAYVTALVFSVLNGVLLWFRISAEERALSGSSDYSERFRGRPRFLPALFRR